MADSSGGSQNRSSGIKRVLQKLKASVDDGEFYEAHQMIRTLHFRYMSIGKKVDALELLYNGTCLLLEKKQWGSGGDLALLMIDCMDKCSQPVNKENIDRIKQVLNTFDAVCVEREEFIKASIKWAGKNDSSRKHGPPELHELIAQVYWKEKNYMDARLHFLYTNSGTECATMLVECSVQEGYPGEADLFIAQVVLQFLCLSNISTAYTTFFTYTEQHPAFCENSRPPYERPLLNFLWFLLLSIQGQASVSQFAVLCEKYQQSLSRDPIYSEYLDKIGQLFFGLPPKQEQASGLHGFIGDVIQSLIGDDEADSLLSSSGEELD